MWVQAHKKTLYGTICHSSFKTKDFITIKSKHLKHATRFFYRSDSLSPSQSQAYVSKCDSVESLNSGENAALLKKEEKTRSQSSLLIFFDDKEIDGQDSCV